MSCHCSDLEESEISEEISKIGSSREAIFFVITFVATIQVIVSAGSYSGYHDPPLFGDFEAQRHWMEITYHLPINKWYVNGSDNDLLYWGLDYPPLTAYHSCLLGAIGQKINSSWFELHRSRGIENETHKFFMRMTVLATFWVLYAFPVFLFVRRAQRVHKVYYLAIFLLYPGLIAMDNGHFQYNHISLGLFLLAFLCFTSDYMALGSILFIFAVNYKQMELYHALPISVFLLATILRRDQVTNVRTSYLVCLRRFIFLALVVSVTLLIVWFPFIWSGSDLLQILHRIFPFYRGLFEDKVANFWYTLSILVKLKNMFEIGFLIKISAIAVMLTNIPCLLALFIRPSQLNFKYALLASSLSFFLFSFQVHEKSILLAAIPALLLFEEESVMVSWFLTITNVSMYPLCVKDGNAVHLSLFAFYYLICSLSFPNMGVVKRYMIHGDCLLALATCLASLVISPPIRYPHIFSLIIAVYSFCHFILFFVYVNYKMLVLTFRWRHTE